MTLGIGPGPWERIDAAVDGILARRGGPVARDREFADLLRAMAAAARTGVNLPAAIRRATEHMRGPITMQLSVAASRMELGLPVEQEIDRFARRVGSPTAGMLAQIIGVQHRRGGDLAAPCHRLAAMLHDRCQLDAEARAATAQARFSARAVLAIPPLLVMLAAWRAPDVVARLLVPGMLLVLVPGILLMVAGGLVAGRVARRAGTVAGGLDAHGPDPALRRWLQRLAGAGPRSSASLRLGAGVVPIAALFLLAGIDVLHVMLAAAALGAAIAWPWADHRRRHDELLVVANSGIEALLELSIALTTAGATPQEVARLAASSAGGALRDALEPAVHRLALGRSITSSFADLPVILASPHLDAWLHAIRASAELGAPATPVLEQLLRDARSMRREQIRAAAATAAPRMQLALVLLVVPGIMWVMLVATVSGLVEQMRHLGVA